MDIDPVKPSRGRAAEAAKLAVSVVYVTMPLGLVAYRFYQNQSVDSLVMLIIVMFMFASAYTVWGERVVEKATDQAQEVTGKDGDDE